MENIYKNGRTVRVTNYNGQIQIRYINMAAVKRNAKRMAAISNQPVTLSAAECKSIVDNHDF